MVTTASLQRRASQHAARRPGGRLLAVLGVCLLLSGTAAHALQGLPDFTDLVADNHKAVVNVSLSAESLASRQGGDNRSPLDEEIERYREREQVPGPFDSRAQGSGFIISKDGFILTNNHVVEGAERVTVSLHDRRQYLARVVGVDPRSDIALLKVDAEDLPVARIGNSDQLEVGEWVLAIGSPFGFDFSVTAGIVSALGRALPTESYVPFIQTDVAINPGNSGGPLFNLKGEVIGINSQIYSRTGSFSGVSFAIPIELAIDVADQLRLEGRVSRGWLGVIIQEVTRDLALSMDMPVPFGALISNILPDGPAARSSLQVGDIITHFNGRRVERSASLPPLVGRVVAGESAQLTIMRQGKPMRLTVRIGELPGDGQQARVPTSTSPNSGRNTLERVLGIALSPLQERQRAELGIDAGGVLIDSVREGGPAARAGLRPGDALLMIDNIQVDSSADALSILESMNPDKPVAVLIQRPTGPEFIAIEPDDAP